MLYCPKCQATYKDGTQRFCTNEGARLLPTPSSEQSGQSSKGVFTSVLGKSSLKPDNKKSETKVSAFQPPIKSKFFKTEDEDEAIEESKPTVSEIDKADDETKQSKPFEHIPLANIIKPNLLQEKQRESDKIFNRETEKTGEISAEYSGQVETQKETPESFESINQDFLDVDFSDKLSSAENRDEIESANEIDLDLSETPSNQDEFELNIENQKADVINSDSELELNLVEDNEVSKDIESEPDFDLDLDEPLEGLDSFELESDGGLKVEDVKDISAISAPPPKFELDLADLDDVSIPSKVELDLESREEVNLADSIPRIELDLAELEDVSIPDMVDNEPDFEQESLETADSKESKIFPPREIKYEISEILQSSLPPVVSNFEEKAGFKDKTETEKLDKPESEKKEEEKIAVAADGTDKTNLTDDPTWEKRSSDAAGSKESKWFLYPLIGIILLAFGLLGFFYLTNQNNSVNQVPANQQSENVNQPNANANLNVNANDSQTNDNANENDSFSNPNAPSSYPGDSDSSGQPRSDLSAVPPLPRTVRQPPNTVLYRNDKKQLKGVMAEKFLGFSIYYPKEWKETKSDNKFLDIARKTPEGLPIKQILISRYDSNGTFDADRPVFERMVEKSNADLRGILSNYEVIYEGETIFQNGRWRVYEVTFQGIGSDKKLIIWGRRLWIPVQRAGMKSGFIITVFGTSLSNDIKSVSDLEKDEELTEILKTFEPEIN